MHIGYTQGMNEILAALFYVFDQGLSQPGACAAGPLAGLKTTAEALSYWAFKEVRLLTPQGYAREPSYRAVSCRAQVQRETQWGRR